MDVAGLDTVLPGPFFVSSVARGTLLVPDSVVAVPPEAIPELPASFNSTALPPLAIDWLEVESCVPSDDMEGAAADIRLEVLDFSA